MPSPPSFTRIVRRGDKYYTITKVGDEEIVKPMGKDNPHPAVKLGLVPSEDYLVLPCPNCDGEMTLRLQTTMAKYRKTVPRELGFSEGMFRWEREETEPPKLIFLYYACDECGTVYPYAEDKESLRLTLERIKSYYESSATGEVPTDNRLYEIAKNLLRLIDEE